MTEFSPVSSMLGGLLIGFAAVLLLLVNGRIAGVSGILGRALPPTRADFLWRLLFVVGLVLGAQLTTTFTGISTEVPPGAPILAAGLLVGFGTQLGNGCTSGHGVCGMARGSKRSIVATCTFMAAGGFTVFVMRHVLGGSS